MLDVLDDYDWKEAFHYAQPEPVPPGTSTPGTPFGREDVKRIIAMSEGLNDDADWLCCGELHDGRYFSLSAGCDYTGWG